jgi:hypothetical protein
MATYTVPPEATTITKTTTTMTYNNDDDNDDNNNDNNDNNNDNNNLTSSLVCFQGSCSGKLKSFLNEGVSRIFQEKITGSSYSELLTLFL